MTTFPEKTVFDSQIDEQLSETTKARIDRPVLIVLDGKDSDRHYPIDKRELVVGRDIRADIVLNDRKCTREHARLIYENFNNPVSAPEVKLVDMNSTNGCYVNGNRVVERLLEDRDKLLLGSTLLGFFLRDEGELEADQRLYKLANHDALTNLRNRGVFNMEVGREFDRARRYGRELALVLFDIDHFKRFNDSYGHQMGDFVLQELGLLVNGNVRVNDIAARYGGEEFAIILPETGLEGALIQAERLRAAIANHSFTRDSTSLTLTVSLGIGTTESHILDVESFIKATDQAMYEAKARGRNRICWMRDGKLHDSMQ